MGETFERRGREVGVFRLWHGGVPDRGTRSRRVASTAELREYRARQAGRDLRFVHADALVFTTARGKPQSRRNVLRAVHAAGDAVGLNAGGRQPVGLHDLRHFYVALALAAGLSLAETAALARHANARVTAQVYAGLAADGREAAAEKLLEAGFGR